MDLAPAPAPSGARGLAVMDPYCRVSSQVVPLVPCAIDGFVSPILCAFAAYACVRAARPLRQARLAARAAAEPRLYGAPPPTPPSSRSARRQARRAALCAAVACVAAAARAMLATPPLAAVVAAAASAALWAAVCFVSIEVPCAGAGAPRALRLSRRAALLGAAALAAEAAAGAARGPDAAQYGSRPLMWLSALGCVGVIFFLALLGREEGCAAPRGAEAEAVGEGASSASLPAAGGSPGVCPEWTAGVLSHVTFSWMSPLIARGEGHALEQADLWSLPPPDRVAALEARFGRFWQRELDAKLEQLRRDGIDPNGPALDAVKGPRAAKVVRGAGGEAEARGGGAGGEGERPAGTPPVSPDGGGVGAPTGRTGPPSSGGAPPPSSGGVPPSRPSPPSSADVPRYPMTVSAGALARACARSVAPLFSLALPCKLVVDVSQFAPPILISEMLAALGEAARARAAEAAEGARLEGAQRAAMAATLPANGTEGGADAFPFSSPSPSFAGVLSAALPPLTPVARAYACAALLFLSLCVGTIADNQHFQLVMRGGFRLRSVLTHRICDKVLRLTPDARARFFSGKLYSAVGTDVDQLQFLSQTILGLVSAPLRIVVAVALLWRCLGPASVGAVALVVLIMPVQAKLMTLQRATLRGALARTDERAKLEGELVTGLEAVKCAGWEIPFLRRAAKARSLELDSLRTAAKLSSANVAIVLAVPVLSAVGLFGFYSLFTHSSPTAVQAFTALSLLAVMRFPMFQLPALITGLIAASVAVERLAALLSAPEAKPIPPLPPLRGDEEADGEAQGAEEEDAEEGAEAEEAASRASAGAGPRPLSSSSTLALAPASSTPSPPPSLSPSSVAAIPRFLRSYSVVLRGSFSWSLQDPPSISGLDLRVRPGELVAIVGPTGSGKSSLLAALLGLLEPLWKPEERQEAEGAGESGGSGEAGSGGSGAGVAPGSSVASPSPLPFLRPLSIIRGSCAYVPQTAYIASATIRENVTFNSTGVDVRARLGLEKGSAAEMEAAVERLRGQPGRGQDRAGDATDAADDAMTVLSMRQALQPPEAAASGSPASSAPLPPFSPALYASALYASCLAPDLAQQPAGDLTELGERGVTISGGQKQRVALARAAYSRPDVALLDDPLSALDAKVGRRVFSRLIKGELRSCTRLLVTNQLQYVRDCDRVLYLEKGRVVEQGSYEQLLRDGGGFAQLMAKAVQEDDQDEEVRGETEEETEEEEEEKEQEEEKTVVAAKVAALAAAAAAPPDEAVEGAAVAAAAAASARSAASARPSASRASSSSHRLCFSPSVLDAKARPEASAASSTALELSPGSVVHRPSVPGSDGAAALAAALRDGRPTGPELGGAPDEVYEGQSGGGEAEGKAADEAGAGEGEGEGGEVPGDAVAAASVHPRSSSSSAPSPEAGTLYEEEGRSRGRVKRVVIATYARALGGARVVALVASAFVFVEVFRVSGQLWLQHWTSDVQRSVGGAWRRVGGAAGGDGNGGTRLQLSGLSGGDGRAYALASAASAPPFAGAANVSSSSLPSLSSALARSVADPWALPARAPAWALGAAGSSETALLGYDWRTGQMDVDQLATIARGGVADDWRRVATGVEEGAVGSWRALWRAIGGRAEGTPGGAEPAQAGGAREGAGAAQAEGGLAWSMRRRLRGQASVQEEGQVRGRGDAGDDAEDDADAHGSSAHADAHADAHGSSAHADAHADAHGSSAHADAHADAHGSSAHADAHADAHDSSAHADAHADAHDSSAHADAHADAHGSSSSSEASSHASSSSSEASSHASSLLSSSLHATSSFASAAAHSTLSLLSLFSPAVQVVLAASSVDPTPYLVVYSVLSLLQVVSTALAQYGMRSRALRAAGRLHGDMLARLVGARMRFFHVTPSGRVVNRLTRDTADVDRSLPDFSSMMLTACLQLVSAVALVVALSPPVALLVAPSGYLFYGLFRRYQASIRELKRVDALTRSPVYGALGEAIAGVASLRAFRAERAHSLRAARFLDDNVVVSLAMQSANRWLSMRMETLSAGLAAAAAACVVAAGAGPALAGNVLTTALGFTTFVGMTLRSASVAETAFNSVERVLEYSTDPPLEDPAAWPLLSRAADANRAGDLGRGDEEEEEAQGRGEAAGVEASARLDRSNGAAQATSPEGLEEGKASPLAEPLLLPASAARSASSVSRAALSPPPGWPFEGTISYSGVEMRYRPGLPLVLRGLTFTIPGGSSCGVVGRTGAGKSSLVGSLFRLTPICGGTISVGGLDASRLPLHRLRRAMAVIPQFPVLFVGTVRFNLDPTGTRSDAELWTALRRAHLKEAIEADPRGLDLPVAEGGAPLSAGQRQLLALARALLVRAKILVLDEATASVDVETDSKIQHTVRTEFADCTVLAVAHRLHTVADFDRILVMDAGKAVEFGSPDQLLEDENGVFASMVRETGKGGERALKHAASQAALLREERDDGEEEGGAA